jgi:hypothetical protein
LKRDKWYSDGDGGTSANGTVECTEDGKLIGLEQLVGEEQFMSWRDQGKQIVRNEADRQWALGLWIVEGEHLKELAGMAIDQRFKNSVYRAAADITGYSVKTIKALVNVVRNVPQELKDEFNVSFAHFSLVAPTSLDLDQKRKLLAEMERCDLTVRQARSKADCEKGLRVERKSKIDRKATRITWHCNKLVDALGCRNFARASPRVYKELVASMEQARRALATELDDETSEPALVSNQRWAAAA